MKEIAQALLKAQAEFPLVKKEDSNPFFKSKYAGLPTVLEAVLPILIKNGIVLSQSPITNGDRIGVRTFLIHTESGEFLDSEFTMALSKNDPQGAGSAITYARRYAIISILGLNVDEDDDGNLASAKKTVNIAEDNYQSGDAFAEVKTRR
jgi:hypothetical protein